MQVIEGQTPSTGGNTPTPAAGSKKGDERADISRVPSETVLTEPRTGTTWFQRTLAKIELRKTESDNFNQSFTNYVRFRLQS